MTERGNTRPTGAPSVEQRIDDGRVFTIRHFVENLGDGSTTSLLLRNPMGSGEVLLTTSPTFQSSAETFAQKIENPTIDTPGSSVTPRNKNLGSPRTSEATAEQGGTYSGGTSRGTEVLGSTVGGGGGGSIGRSDLALRLDPGETVQYKIESNAAGNDVAIVVTWIEEDEFST